MAISDTDLIKVRKRFYEDFDFYAPRALKVRAKKGEIVPFALNPVQKRFQAAVDDQRRRTGRVRMIILKGRQQGFSTYVGGRKYWRLTQRSARKGIVVAHKADSTRALFDMYQRYHTSCPDFLKPSTKFSSRKELVFDKLDTGIMVATAGGDGIARGEMLTDAHLSEYAFWPASTARENLNGLLQAIPNTDDTEVYIESTANGYNDFYRICQEAIKGESEFEFFFAAVVRDRRVPRAGAGRLRAHAGGTRPCRPLRTGRCTMVWRRRKIAAAWPRTVHAGVPVLPRGSVHRFRASRVRS
jgi:hypothetical protein